MNTTLTSYAADAIVACGAKSKDEELVCRALSESFVRHAALRRPLTIKERQHSEEVVVRRAKKKLAGSIAAAVLTSILIRLAIQFFRWAWGRMFDHGGTEEIVSISVSMGCQ